jgi:hypothetical protein
MKLSRREVQQILERQCTENWRKLVAKKIDLTEFNRRSQVAWNWYTRQDLNIRNVKCR